MANKTKENTVTRPPDPYARIANRLLYDKRLTFKAKGLYAYMYSKPDNWKFACRRIASEGVDGLFSVRKGLAELIEHGWIIPHKKQNGTIEYEMLAKSNNCTLQKPHNAVTAALSNTELLSKTDLKERDITLDKPSREGQSTAPAYDLSIEDLEVIERVEQG